ncbi:PepSY domain-containing protein [Cypionkella sp.]|uniref:PepSY domain-containing protein n=1 Tax=Cypionkella sp. TaxID=2811411 RepID=UPI002742EF36|nr:PepSY domain-containing protein [Cypionkella sp.]
MIRSLHRWPGLIAAAFLILLAVTGTALSVFPALETVTTSQASAQQNVAELAAMVQAQHPSVEQIKRAPTGKITAWWFDGNTAASAVVDPATGKDAGSTDPNRLEQWLINLHRSLFLNDNGRMVTAVAALSMLVLALSGALLVSRRVGGWRRWFARLRGPWEGRIHSEMARLAVPFLVISAVTALWMTASTFSLLPDDSAYASFPSQTSGQTGFDVAQMAGLQSLPVSQLRDLTFPAAGDATDVFTLTTDRGMGYLDQGTGAMLAWSDNGPWAQVGEWIYLLHTGQGAAIWGLLLGLMALSIPALAITGALSWAKARRGRPALRGMAAASKAQTLILVGSEGGSTWGFATTLAKNLQTAGQSVHMAALNSFAPERYRHAERIVVMTATWGEGTAPSSAKRALERLAEASPTVPMTVLGFGDSSFPDFCGFATSFETAARAKGWDLILPEQRIDRGSPQEFARWGQAFGAKIGLALELHHQPSAPKAQALSLLSRRDYGEAVQAPAAILRFALPKTSLWARLIGRGMRFQAGDLLGIVPQGARIPRYYSLASASANGFVEIVARKHPGGLCSGQLMALQPGDSVQAFLRPNPDFHPDRGTTPLILIGAGTGIGPLAGFIRSQGNRRPLHLWFGARHPDTDLFYGQELAEWSENGQLAGLTTAFSRSGKRHYVQDALRQDGEALRELIQLGARIMVCGGRDMATGVQQALTEVLAPLGLTAANLKSEGRYAEDVY